MTRIAGTLWICALLAAGACLYIWRHLNTSEGILASQRIRIEALEREAHAARPRQDPPHAGATASGMEKPAGETSASSAGTAERDVKFREDRANRVHTMMTRRDEFTATQPAYRSAVSEGLHLDARRRFAELRHWMSVSDRVLDEFIRQEAQYWMDMGQLRYELRGEDQNGPLYRARDGELQVRHQEESRKVLGEENYRRWQEWNQSSNARGHIKVLNQQLPITQVVRDEHLPELAMAMHKAGQHAQETWWASPEHKQMSATAVGMDRETRTRVARQRSLEQKRRMNAAMLAAAQPLLSKAQYQMLAANLQSDLAQHEAGL